MAADMVAARCVSANLHCSMAAEAKIHCKPKMQESVFLYLTKVKSGRILYTEHDNNNIQTIDLTGNHRRKP